MKDITSYMNVQGTDITSKRTDTQNQFTIQVLIKPVSIIIIIIII